MNNCVKVFIALCAAASLLAGGLASAQPGRGADPERMPRSPGPVMGELMERLEASDDGLTHEEVRETMSNMPAPMFERMDLNDDGRLTHAEAVENMERWRARMQERRPEDRPRGPEGMMGDLMERLEASEDGLTLEEVRETMPNLPEPMFNRMDLDDDGRLTHAEAVESMERWRARMEERRDEGARRTPPRAMAERRGEVRREDRRERPERGEGPRAERPERGEGRGEPRSEWRQRVRQEEDLSDEERARNRAAMMWGRMLERADEDGSGSISRAEFEAAFPNAPAERFDALDHNGDGVLTRRDMRSHLEDGTFPGLWGRDGARLERQRRSE